jgi:hypothetical protein
LVLGGNSGQTPARAAAGDTPTLFQWEEYVDPSFLAEYRQIFREAPKTAIFADEDEAFAKMRAGFKPDVMGPCYYEFPRWQEAQLLQPIDTTKLKNWSKISPAQARCGSCHIIGATPPSPIVPIWRPNMSGMNRGTSCSIRNTRAGSQCSKASTTRFRSSRG